MVTVAHDVKTFIPQAGMDRACTAHSPQPLRLGSHHFSFDRPLVMGILNVTPDSFSDGGRFFRYEKAIAHAERMLAAGADIIDIGGESTRPNAQPVTDQEEIDRTIPVVEYVARTLKTAVSIDTSKPSVMRAAIAAGASLVNDVRALRYDGALDVLKTHADVAVCLMHMRGTPATMQQSPQYADVIADICAFLRERIAICVNAGIERARILIDPGIGFGKTKAHNVRILAHMPAFVALGQPVLIGVSRKSVLGDVLGSPVQQRLAASMSAMLYAIMRGAHIVRVHDVQETVDAVTVWQHLVAAQNDSMV